jgi:16S rRNA C1402 (ribose-2'-O) methylase RsmI
LTHILRALEKRPEIKGECTLLVTGNIKPADIALDVVRKELRKQLALADQQPISDFAKEMARRYGLPKQQIYNEVLRLKASHHDSDR